MFNAVFALLKYIEPPTPKAWTFENLLYSSVPFEPLQFIAPPIYAFVESNVQSERCPLFPVHVIGLCLLFLMILAISGLSWSLYFLLFDGSLIKQKFFIVTLFPLTSKILNSFVFPLRVME